MQTKSPYLWLLAGPCIYLGHLKGSKCISWTPSRCHQCITAFVWLAQSPGGPYEHHNCSPLGHEATTCLPACPPCTRYSQPQGIVHNFKFNLCIVSVISSALLPSLPLKVPFILLPSAQLFLAYFTLALISA